MTSSVRNVWFYGQIGNDSVGRSYMEGLKQTTVNIEQVQTIDDAPTGVAAISVDKSGRPH